MFVEATKAGFYRNRFRYPGNRFQCDDKDFSAKWMRRLDTEEPEPAPAEPVEPAVTEPPKRRPGRPRKSQEVSG